MPIPSLPLPAGIGLRSPHIAEMLRDRPPAGWLEIHAENYMNDGPAVAALDRLRRDYAISVHGVGLSLGSAGVDHDHLMRFKQVVDRFEPAFISEHVAWSVGEGVYLNDLLPLPYDEEALGVVARNIETVQDALKRTILIENLSHYVGLAQATMSEPEFLAALARRTGCGILLDVNNIFISAHNVGFDAGAYFDRLPADAIQEIHLAGHHRNDTEGGPILIDNHGSQVSEPVWALYREALGRFGRKPTLIEWDSDLPPLAMLLAEARRADVQGSLPQRMAS